MKKTRIAVMNLTPEGGALALAKAFEAAEEGGSLPSEKIKRVDFLDPGTVKPVKAPKARAEDGVALGEVVDGMNERHFSGCDNALFAVRNPDGTSCVKFAGKGTDGSLLADGKRALRFSADYKDEKKLMGDILGFEGRGLMRGLEKIDGEHPKADAEENFDPLCWRPESKDAPVPGAVIEARLSLLNAGDRKAVEDAMKDKTVPGFLYYYCGGKDDAATREGRDWKGEIEEGELRALHLCAYISKSEAQAMRIFRSSGAYEAGSGKPYPVAMDEAFASAEAFRKAARETESPAPSAKKVGYAGKEL